MLSTFNVYSSSFLSICIEGLTQCKQRHLKREIRKYLLSTLQPYKLYVLTAYLEQRVATYVKTCVNNFTPETVSYIATILLHENTCKNNDVSQIPFHAHLQILRNMFVPATCFFQEEGDEFA